MDTDKTICIPASRYEDLIRAEMEREILFHAYQSTDLYHMEPVMDAIFNPKFKHKDEDYSGGKAVAEEPPGVAEGAQEYMDMAQDNT